MTTYLPVHVCHMTRDDRRTTECGEPWQGWQAPPDAEHIVIVRPLAVGDSIRQCQACLYASRRIRV